VKKSVVDRSELHAHIAEASTPRLLLVAVHVTGEPTLLDRYEHRVGCAASPLSIDPNPPKPAEPEPGVREELIQIIEDVLCREDQPAYLGVEDRALFERMQNLAVGFEVPRNQSLMNREQAGFMPEHCAAPAMPAPPKNFKVAIIGAGMTGIDAAVKAVDRGLEWELFEKESGVGGLWHSQRYPGVAVDTPALYYSLSWEITPDWSLSFPLGAEYRKYLQDIVAKYDLAPRIRLNSEVVRMEWLEDRQEWELTVRSRLDGSERTVHASVVIGGAGHLCRPNYPQVPGMDTFAGKQMHTAAYSEGTDLAGKRVGVVGVAASGVQVIAAIAPGVGHLTVFQRQPVWLSRNIRGDGKVGDSERWLRRNLPYYINWSRLEFFALVNRISPAMNQVDPEWMKTHPTSVSQMSEMLRQQGLSYIHDAFGESSELGRKVTPQTPYGGKRPVRDPSDLSPGGYYWALKQPHVHLETSGVERVVPEGIVTADGVLHQLDVIIWATGLTWDFMSPVQIIGRDGLTLREAWDDYLKPRTYLGGTIPGFPNFFMNDGPHTGVANGGGGHNFMTETVNHYAFEAIEQMLANSATSIEVKQQAYDQHHQRLLDRMQNLIWTHDLNSNTYYRNSTGYVVVPSPFFVEELWDMMQRPDPEAFQMRAPQIGKADMAVAEL
jgi:cation diffusion facilitator CzcD-associated flavoprotein CzcO